jgi:hypothetical protein
VTGCRGPFFAFPIVVNARESWLVPCPLCNLAGMFVGVGVVRSAACRYPVWDSSVDCRLMRVKIVSREYILTRSSPAQLSACHGPGCTEPNQCGVSVCMAPHLIRGSGMWPDVAHYISEYLLFSCGYMSVECRSILDPDTRSRSRAMLADKCVWKMKHQRLASPFRRGREPGHS